MKIEDILKMNEEYEKKRKELDSFYKQVREASNTIDLEEVKKLDYEEVRKIKSTLWAKFESNVYDAITNILYNKKLEKYPQFKFPHRFPELKELVEKYGLENIMVLDEFLASLSVNDYFVYESDYYFNRRIRELTLKEEDLKEIFDFLHEKGIVEYSYTLLDEETGCKEYMSEKEYEFYAKNLQLEEDRDEKYFYLELYRDEDECDDYGEYESYKVIDNYEDLTKLTKLVSIKRCKKPLADEEIISM